MSYRPSDRVPARNRYRSKHPSAQALAEQPTALYRLWGDDGELLWIGITAHLRNRMYMHKQRRPETTSLSMELFPNRDAALAAEYEALAKEKPRDNRGGGRRPTRDISRNLDRDLAA